MSRKEAVDRSMEEEALAFEYALGTLDTDERLGARARLQQDEALSSLTNDWQETFMALQNTNDTLAPPKTSWAQIEQRLHPKRAVAKSTAWLSQLVWGLSGACASLFVCVLTFGIWQSSNTQHAGFDYIAVMSSGQGNASLTTLGNSESHTLTLQWHQSKATDHQDYQIWAQSKRDGDIRSIAIIDDSSTKQVTLSEAEWRLIADAQSLILTLEDQGGSAMDEPSDLIVASGLCVRLAPI